MKIRVGTRDSKLAMIQTEIVVENIKQYDSSIEIEIIPMKTTGDKILDVTLDKIGGKGLFVKELDEALQKDMVDITVHSFKDMPMDENPELPIVAVSRREDPRDVLILNKENIDADQLDKKSLLVGTSSKRRQVQLEKLGYQNIKPIRGNLVSRFKKLDEGEFDAIVLAAAGIKRSGLEDRISEYFSVEEIIPSAGQGVLAVQGRAGQDYSYLQHFHDPSVYIVTKAERAFVRKLDGGCSTPTAAYGVIEAGELLLTGLFQSDTNELLIKQIKGTLEEAETLGKTLAQSILDEIDKKERLKGTESYE
ncbi:MAG: hydroxymethylbilane synthase [Eubacteriales bacterium]